MKSLWMRFLTARFSGWLSIVALIAFGVVSGFVTKQVADYKDLQVRAAYCEGQLSVTNVLERVQDRAVSQVERAEDDAVEEIKDEIEQTPDQCAAQRAPDALLEYHGVRPN